MLKSIGIGNFYRPFSNLSSCVIIKVSKEFYFHKRSSSFSDSILSLRRHNMSPTSVLALRFRDSVTTSSLLSALVVEVAAAVMLPSVVVLSVVVLPVVFAVLLLLGSASGTFHRLPFPLPEPFVLV